MNLTVTITSATTTISTAVNYSQIVKYYQTQQRKPNAHAFISLPRSFDTEPVSCSCDVNHCETFSLSGTGRLMLDSGFRTGCLPLDSAAGREWAWLRPGWSRDEGGGWFSVLCVSTYWADNGRACFGGATGRLNTALSRRVPSKVTVFVAS